jgi:formylglycine-generating enzyme required for sulfatase activity/tRNA A-37 threonylcarbamoyl transferase component Bud32
MSSDLWSEIKAVFQQAIELDPASRAAFLAQQPESIRAEIESLLAADAVGRLTTLAPESTAASAGELGPVGKLFGPYRVISLLGHGGMGSVWLAERADGLFERNIALKLVHPMLMSPATLSRFAREREILAAMVHPNIAQLIDAGIASDGQPYLALEYVDGKPITTYCDERRLTLDKRLEIFQLVLNAVDYAHRQEVIHRDIKPSNIMTTADGKVRLLDFGIAKLLSGGEARETELTRLAGRALTPDYAAPEQVAGDVITPAADVYALGLLLFELLSGDKPQRRTLGPQELRQSPIILDPPTPTESSAAARATTSRQLASDLRGELWSILRKALASSPRDRYATAGAMAQDIARFQCGEVVHAPADTLPDRVLRVVRRNRRALRISVAGVLVAAIAGPLLWPWRWEAGILLTAAGDRAVTILGMRVKDPTLQPGQVFKDCNLCPEMVVLPAGQFLMGGADNEPEADADERPAHTVILPAPLAVSRFEVTFDEWDACEALHGCKWHATDDGFGRGRRPVINVSWFDAQSYAAWLSERTGRPYRLLSESEWEYAARGGSTTQYPWGNDVGRGKANCKTCGSEWDNRETAPVGSFAANGFGLYDTQGNVFEWVEDCWHSDYTGAPSDGGAWKDQCVSNHRVLRGGAYGEPPIYLRAAHRDYETPMIRGGGIGFRIARALGQSSSGLPAALRRRM